MSVDILVNSLVVALQYGPTDIKEAARWQHRSKIGAFVDIYTIIYRTGTVEKYKLLPWSNGNRLQINYLIIYFKLFYFKKAYYTNATHL